MIKIKKTIRCICLLLIISSLLSLPVYADGKESQYFSSYGGYCYSAGSNTVQIWFNVKAKFYVDQLGSTSITLYESSDQSTWTSVKTFSYANYSSMMRSNNYIHNSHVSYYNAVSGYYYYALITVTIIDGSNSESRSFSTYSIQA